jgi:hypothetical protein
VETSLLISHRRPIERRATPHALVAHRVVTASRAHSGRALGVWAGQRLSAGLWPSRPLWPWAIMRLEGIVHFSIFPGIYSNRIQIKFSLNLNLFKPIQT